MKFHYGRLAAGALLVAATALLGSAEQANATTTTITFGTNDGLVDGVYHLGATYTEQGYTFSSALGDLVTWGNGQSADPDPTDSVSLIGYHPLDAITLTRSDGGVFDLTSIDFQGYVGALNPGDGLLNFTWVFANGLTGSGSDLIRHDSWTTELFSLQGLRSFTWQPASSDLNWAWADNVTVVATTPIPAALPLFMSGLGALGFVRLRRKA